jgi:hypothetical protein
MSAQPGPKASPLYRFEILDLRFETEETGVTLCETDAGGIFYTLSHPNQTYFANNSYLVSPSFFEGL